MVEGDGTVKGRVDEGGGHTGSEGRGGGGGGGVIQVGGAQQHQIHPHAETVRSRQHPTLRQETASAKPDHFS